MIKSITKRKRLRQTIQTIITKNNKNNDKRLLFYAFNKSIWLMLFQSLIYFRL